MKGFFEAQSVAVVGVSNAPTNMGQAIVGNLLEFRYTGTIHLVGPKGGSLLGRTIHRSVTDIPDPVDLAVILVPAVAVPEVLGQCAQKGIKRVVVESGGFRELGQERLGLEKEVDRILLQHGMRMIGPNCLGIISRRNGLAVPFLPMRAEVPVGHVAIIAQSGGVGAMMVNFLAEQNLGLSRFASIGNRQNVDETDLLEYLVEDEETESVFCYLEGIADGRRLMGIATRSPKPILAHKANRGAQGSVIARSHSASLAADDRVVDAAFQQCGVVQTRHSHEAVELLKAFSLPPIRGSRLAIISRSGGHAVIAADAAGELGFDLPPYPEDVIQLVQAHARANVIRFHNPLDLGDVFDLQLYRTLAEQTLAREDVDALLFTYNYQGLFDQQESRELVVALGEVMAAAGKPLALCLFTTHSELDHNRRTVSFPIFTDSAEALRGLALRRDRAKSPPLPLATERPAGIDRSIAQAALEACPSGPISPGTLAAVLSAYGVPLTPWETVTSEAAAVAASLRLGFPVALKTAQPEVIHKSDAGGVHLGLTTEGAVRDAYRGLYAIGPSVLVQTMAEPGLEWIVGGRQDVHFGPVLVAGLGGIYVEAFDATGLRVAPIGHEEATRLLDGLRGSKLLEGIRGRPALDRQAFLDLMVRVSWLLADFPQIRELDLNPVRLYPDGCLALDWRAVHDTTTKP